MQLSKILYSNILIDGKLLVIIMTIGKKIELFLAQGTMDGLVTAELSNWNGKAIKIPRTDVLDCERDDIRGVGVYFLFCQDEVSGKDAVYIGEAENVYQRLKQHMAAYKAGKEEYYWHTAVCFISSMLNKALIRYLEDQLVSIAKSCGKYDVLTKTTYDTWLKEADIASMGEFIENIKVLLGTLGYKVLVPVPQGDEKTVYLYCKCGERMAKGFITTNGFTVVKDSAVSKGVVPSFIQDNSYYKLRQRLEADGTICEGTFSLDYEFSSPSAAAAVVRGSHSNGNILWKTQDGVKLRDL
ncbi:GIY-YIG nuclease family protein [Megasphaera sp. ASD88]|uniref:GIY-YIG nuclease family protein n=1 Tax=Megasphaera sp. ASD88 TaxID=2027407 RepID=UPI0018E95A5B|nr:GIY-YIG nuclease family protein [Megasphaera sp. ASD88]